ncbi:MAG TPA: caspase family protein [Methylomirabilota bacterium]|nr:caspase family protein [Methylomirabilota bacterium]
MTARKTIGMVVPLLAAALLGSSTDALAQKPRAELPAYELGEQWRRSDGVFELTRVEADRYVFTAASNREVHLGKDLAPIKNYNNGYWIEMSPPMTLKWPLEVGKWGSSSTTWKWHGQPLGNPARLQWEVKAYEEIRVGGKPLNAFRVEWEVRYPNNVHRVQTLWYAPDARQWVKAEGVREMTPLWSWVVFDVAVQAPIVATLESPANEERITGDSTRVSARIRSKAGVSDVRISVNGAEVFSGQPGTRDYSTYEPVKLKEGKNVILLTATEKNGQKIQEARVVYSDKAVASAPPEPPAIGAAPPKPAPPPVVATPEPKPTPPPVIATPAPKPPPPPVVATPAPKPPPPPVIAAPEPKPAPAPPVVASLPPAAPLVVRLASPSDKAKVEHETVALAGVASGGRGVSRVLVTVNGVEVLKHDEKTPARAVPLNLPLKLREGANTLVVSVTDADGAIEQEIRSIAYEKPVPFAIHFRYPEDRAKVTDASSLVAAVVESSRGVSLTRILVNGTQVHEQSERAAQRSMLVTTPVTLREGANAIVITATQTDGTVRQEIRTVVYEAPKVALPLPPAPATAPPAVKQDRWAVVIGVGAYESNQIPRLKFSVADAEAIYQTLIGPAGFKKDNVLLLTDKSERKPTLRNIKWALGTFLGRSAKKDDTVLIFFAGHGAPEVDTRGIERDGLAKYLIPSDADPDDLYSTALPMDELQTIFARIESERVIAFLDACYSGAAGGRTFAAKRTRAGAVDDLFLERLTRSKGRAIVTASRPTEVSIELPELGHGIFTYYLVNGLKGAADLNRDGIVSLQELYEYLEQQVSTKSRSVGGNQHPVMKGELEGVLPLTKVSR